MPTEDVKTLSVSYRLMARASLDRVPVSRLTEHLFRMRSSIARTNPIVNSLRAPENEGATSSVLPNHRGALDYFNREQLTFIRRYGDWLWLGVFASGSVSSVAAWIVQRSRRRRRERVDLVLHRFSAVLRGARRATSPSDLDRLTREVDTLIATAVQDARLRTTTTRVMSALVLAANAARAAIADRRRELLQAP